MLHPASGIFNQTKKKHIFLYATRKRGKTCLRSNLEVRSTEMIILGSIPSRPVADAVGDLRVAHLARPAVSLDIRPSPFDVRLTLVSLAVRADEGDDVAANTLYLS